MRVPEGTDEKPPLIPSAREATNNKRNQNNRGNASNLTVSLDTEI